MEHRRNGRRSGLPAVLRVGTVVLVLVALCAVVPRVALAQSSSYKFTQVAKVGDSVGNGSQIVSYFEPAAINDLGEVLFAPDLTTGGEGVILWRHGQLTTIAKGGDDNLPGGGVLGYTLSPLAMNLFGDAALVMTRDGNSFPSPSGFNAGVYRYSPRTGVVPVMVPGLKGHGDGSFLGSEFVTAINNRGEVVFTGMICSTAATSVPTLPCPNGGSGGLALGVYMADAHGTISAVVQPGDPAPGGGHKTFDLARRAFVNNLGDIGFAGHVYGEPCVNPGPLYCHDSVYVKWAATGMIESIAHLGDPSPVPGKNYGAAYGPVPNDGGDVVFLADLSDKDDLSAIGVFLHRGRTTMVIAKPGDAMPGGGTLVTSGQFPHNAYINDLGDIAFIGTLDNGDHGVYAWRRGTLGLVAKTGTNTGVGTISSLDDLGAGQASTYVTINDFGQVIFAAKFQEGGGALLMATPK